MKRLAIASALIAALCAPALADLPPLPANVQRAVMLEWATANCDMSDNPMAVMMAPVAAAMIQSQPAEAAEAHRAYLREQAGDDIPGYCAKVQALIPRS